MKSEKKRDHETLAESSLYQYAYLERLLQACKQEKNPRSKSQLLVTGKDKAFNSEILGARQLVDKVIEMADEAAKDYAENNGLIHETCLLYTSPSPRDA